MAAAGRPIPLLLRISDVDQFEDFYSVQREEEAADIAALLQRAGIRFRQRIEASCCTDYVISVHIDDLARADALFADKE